MSRFVVYIPTTSTFFTLFINIEHAVCEGKTEGLVRYPTTLSPASESVNVTSQCADNAHRISSSLNVSCTSSGNWSGTTPQCQCDTGYRAIAVGGRQICQGS